VAIIVGDNNYIIRTRLAVLSFTCRRNIKPSQVWIPWKTEMTSLVRLEQSSIKQWTSCSLQHRGWKPRFRAPNSTAKWRSPP